MNKVNKEETKVTKSFVEKPPSSKYLFWEIIFASIVFTLGIIVAENAHQIIQKENIVFPAYSLSQFLALFLLGTLFVLLIVFLPKIKKIRGKIYKIIFIFSTSYGTLITLSIVFSRIIANAVLSDVISLIVVFLILFWWIKKPTLASHNLLIGFGLAGISGMLGLSFEPKVLILILVILSIYDFVAVYKTKHMVKIAESMVQSGAMMGFIIPHTFAEFLENTEGLKPGGKFLILGGGDVAFPLMFSVSLIPFGIEKVIFVAIFSLFGMSLSHFLFHMQKEKRAIPALPPIAFFSILGYIICLFLYCN